jgi:hypothetical protein
LVAVAVAVLQLELKLMDCQAAQEVVVEVLLMLQQRAVLVLRGKVLLVGQM